MRIIDGLDYYQKLNHYIDECIQRAQEAPFEDFIFIVDNKDIVEELFLSRLHYLVNIRIMTWNQFLKEQIIQYHYTHHHVYNTTELTYSLYKLLKHNDYQCFHTDNPFALIKEIIPVLQNMNLSMVNYTLEDVKNDPKLSDLLKIYQSFNQEHYHFSLEDILKDCDFNQTSMHLYIEGDHLYDPLIQHIIHQLDKHNDVTVLYTYHQDDRLLNNVFHPLCKDADHFSSDDYMSQNLFNQDITKYDGDMKHYQFVSPTPHHEVNRVIYKIQSMVVDEGLRYQDFMIVYPDRSYELLIRNALDALHIPHHLPYISDCVYDQSYQTILNSINSFNESSLSNLSQVLKDQELDSQYMSYLDSLVDYDEIMTHDELLSFFEMTYLNNHLTQNQPSDYVQVCLIHQAINSHPQHIFYIGMNETVFPHFFKDTDLLLSEDINFLKNLDSGTPLTPMQKLSIHHNDILKAMQLPALSYTYSYASSSLSQETKLPSSLFNQLKKMFDLEVLPYTSFMPIDDFYLRGGMLKEYQEVNDLIKDYVDYKNQPLSLNPETTNQLYSPTLSVSQIETYNKCPYLYFIQYGLGVYPLKENKLLPNEIGSLVHYVLSVNLDGTKDISTIVDDYINNDEHLSDKINTKINQYFIEQVKRDLKMTIEVIQEYFDATLFDVHSDEEKVEDDIQGISFKGFVDRIDHYKNYMSIVDYKSSAKDINLNLAMQGFNIQMLLYLKMVTKKYQKDPGAVLYFNTKRRILTSKSLINESLEQDDYLSMYRYGGYVIDDDKHEVIHALDQTLEKKSNYIKVSYSPNKDTYKGQILTPDQLDILLSEIEKHIVELYEMIHNGEIGIHPKGSDDNSTHMLVNPCRYCHYKSVCHFDVFYNEDTKVEFLDVDKILGGEEDAI